MDLAALAREHELADGRSVLVRPVRADDERREAAFLARLSPEARRLRFQRWRGDPAEMARPEFAPDDAIEFWDLTNRQDWHVCELQQQGTASRAFTQGRYSSMESSVHGFDLMVADRYANDGVITAQDRVSKERSAEALKERASRAARGQAAD